MSSKGVRTEPVDQNIYSVCSIMHKNNIVCVIVVDKNSDNQKPVGIINERDVVRILGTLNAASLHNIQLQHLLPLRILLILFYF